MTHHPHGPPSAPSGRADDSLRRFVSGRLSEDERLAAADTFAVPRETSRAVWVHGPPATLPERVLLDLATRRHQLDAWVRATPGSERRTRLRRRVESSASRYDLHPAYDVAWRP